MIAGFFCSTLINVSSVDVDSISARIAAVYVRFLLECRVRAAMTVSRLCLTMGSICYPGLHMAVLRNGKEFQLTMVAEVHTRAVSLAGM